MFRNFRQGKKVFQNVHLSKINGINNRPFNYLPPLAACITTVILSTSYADNSSIAVEQPKLISQQVIQTLQKETITKYFIRNTKETLKKIRDILSYIRRMISYMIYGVPVAILATTAVSLGDSIPWFEDFVWDYCLWSIQKLGPTFIKLAQWASTRPDLYPPKLIEKFKHLQDNVKVDYTIEKVKETLSDAFGDK